MQRLYEGLGIALGRVRAQDLPIPIVDSGYLLLLEYRRNIGLKVERALGEICRALVKIPCVSRGRPWCLEKVGTQGSGYHVGFKRKYRMGW